MKTDNLLSTLLYGLLIGLICLAGWKACEMKKEKAAQAREQAELSRDLGYVSNDSLGTPSSTYADGSAENPTSTEVSKPAVTTVSPSGIEGEVSKPTTSSTPTTSKSAATKPPVVAKTSDDDEADAPKTAKKSRDAVRDLDTDSKKYAVIAGSFTQMANARKLMEELVKKGFHDAEVGRFNKGKFGCAIADQTDNKKTADAVLAKLKAKGYKDAFIKERK